MLNYIIDGSDKPYFLFGGTALALVAIVCLGWSSSKVVETTPSAVVTDKAIINMTAKNKESLMQAHSSSEDEEIGNFVKIKKTKVEEDEEKKKKSILQYVMILVLFGVTNSSWTACSTIAGDNANVNLKALSLGIARFLVQIPVQFIYSKISGKFTFVETIREAFKMPSRDRKLSAVCGILVSLGYWTYFNAVSHVNPAVAFAVSNCSPLVTTLVGVFVLGELQKYTNIGKFGVALSSIFFVSAIICISLAN